MTFSFHVCTNQVSTLRNLLIVSQTRLIINPFLSSEEATRECIDSKESVGWNPNTVLHHLHAPTGTEKNAW